MLKAVSGTIIVLLLFSAFPLASVQPAKAAGTITIMADGSVVPADATILNVGNVSYTFTGNINDSLVVERDNIVVDGAGYTLLGAGAGYGVYLSDRSNVTIKNLIIEAFEYGILLSNSSSNTLYANTITNNTYDGIHAFDSSGNSISANTITNNSEAGIRLYDSSSNSISANNITRNNEYGIWLHDYSSSNSISANNITNNNYFGIKLYSSSSNNIFENNVSNNGWYGIRLEFSSGNSMFANNASNNGYLGDKNGEFYCGILLYSSSNNSISANNISDNKIGGIYTHLSSNNDISANNIANTNYGIELRSSSHSIVSANNVTNNKICGIHLWISSDNNSISANKVTNNNDLGILLHSSNNNSLSANNLANNTNGISLTASSNNSISANGIANNAYGIELYSSSYNRISANYIASSDRAIYLFKSASNSIFHNNFVGNRVLATIDPFGDVVSWDDGYPSGGNYWSNYSGIDFYSGPYQNVTGSDGIGDTPYAIDANNTDRYPLMSEWSPVFALEGVTTWCWTNNTVVNSVAVGDVDGDGQVETVTGGFFNDGVRDIAQLVVWNSSSLTPEQLTTWYWIDNTTITSVATGDVDGDGGVEIVSGGYYFDGTRKVAQLVVWNGSNLAVEGVTTWYWANNTVINSIAVGDVDSDAQAEIVTGGYFNDDTRDIAQLVVWNGTDLSVDRLTTWYWTNNTIINTVAIGDVDADNQTEIVTGGYYNDDTRNIAQLVVWNGTDLSVDRLTTWYWTNSTTINSVAIGDVDADGQTEIVTAGNFNDDTRNVAQLVVWAGSTLAVDRLTTWYWIGDTAINSVALGDMDGDDQVEIVTGGYYNDNARDVAQMVAWSGSNLAVENIRTWYWVSDTTINSVCLSDLKGASSVEIVTGGAYHDGFRWIAQLTIWSM